MDGEEEVVAAIGVLLTQVRTARRALEDVQRNTARYTGFEFAKALAEGPAFAAPPMLGGALLVHVVNINDLAPGNSFGAFLSGLFGGIGNFIGNLFGGTVGGLLSSLALPDMIQRLERIVADVRWIVARVAGDRPQGQAAGQVAASTAQAQATTGPSLLTQLEGIRGTIRDATALLQAAGSGPGSADGANRAGETSATPLTRTGEAWMAILDGVNRLLDRTTHLVNGLILLIPNIVGGLALLVANLGAIRQALLETIQFLLRNALILRGVLLTVIFETIASAARLGSQVLTILGTTIQSILGAIARAVRALVGAAFDALGTLANALQAIVRSLLQWMVTGVFNALRAIGDLAVFRTIDHLVRILPALIPPIYMLMNKGATPPPNVLTPLRQAHEAAFPQAGAPAQGRGPGTGPAGTTSIDISHFPDIQGILQPLQAALDSNIDATGNHLQVIVDQAFDSASGGVNALGRRFSQAARDEGQFSARILRDHAQRIQGQADTLANTITAPIRARGPATGLERLASAYEAWLTGGGLNALLNQIAPHFTNAPAPGEPPGALRLLRGQFDRPRASIEIDTVEIVLEPLQGDAGSSTPAPSGCGVCMTDEHVYRAYRRYATDLEDRVINEPDAWAMA